MVGSQHSPPPDALRAEIAVLRGAVAALRSTRHSAEQAARNEARVTSNRRLTATTAFAFALGVAVTVSVLANDTDPDAGQTLTVTAVGSVVGGTAVINGGTTVTFTPTAGFSGAGSFTYTISDGNGGTAVATVTVAIA